MARTKTRWALLLALAAAACRSTHAGDELPPTLGPHGPRVVPARTASPLREPGPEVHVRVSRSGSGAAAQPGSTVCLLYDAFVRGESERLASTRGFPGPLIVTLGEERWIPGFERGLLGLRAGARARIEVPPELAYGDAGRPEVGLPPDATLVFDVEVLAVR